MNREILFRGKRSGTGEWIEGYFGQSVDSFIIQDHGLVAGCFEMFKVIPQTVGQYIGLTDQKGRKIFEGDVLQCEINGEVDITENYLVIWDTDDARFALEVYKNGKLCFIDDEFQPISCFFIIGNIHDNPDLLPSANKDTAEDAVEAWNRKTEVTDFGS